MRVRYLRWVVGVGVVRNGALLQLENVVRLLERRARWQVGRRVEAGRRSVRRLVHLSQHVGESSGRLEIRRAGESGRVGGILGCLEAGLG